MKIILAALMFTAVSYGQTIYVLVNSDNTSQVFSTEQELNAAVVDTSQSPYRINLDTLTVVVGTISFQVQFPSTTASLVEKPKVEVKENETE